MLRTIRKSVAVRAFGAGAIAGAAMTMVMPDEWSNLAFTPSFVAWIILPSFLVYAAICVVLMIDFVSNSGANPHVLAALWAVSTALVTGVYGLGVSAAVKLARRLRAGADRNR